VDNAESLGPTTPNTTRSKKELQRQIAAIRREGIRSLRKNRRRRDFFGSPAAHLPLR
jgi:DNA-binding IclR family transcriptional regulator